MPFWPPEVPIYPPPRHLKKIYASVLNNKNINFFFKPFGITQGTFIEDTTYSFMFYHKAIKKGIQINKNIFMTQFHTVTLSGRAIFCYKNVVPTLQGVW